MYIVHSQFNLINSNYIICFSLKDGKITGIWITDEKYNDFLQGISMKFDFTWFPFDTQKFIVPIIAGNYCFELTLSGP